jgi:hypothetical protein
MQVLPQALPTVQILQQDWASGVERRDPLTPRECNSLFCVWDCANTVFRRYGAVWALAAVVSEEKTARTSKVRGMTSLHACF